MKNDVIVNDNFIIPESELEITTSRAGGPGGQHVNKTDTKITVRWNVANSGVFDEELKRRIMQNLQSRLTTEGDLIIQNSASRSQQQNRKNALDQLAKEIKKALFVPKKRMKTKVSQQAKEQRLHKKSARSEIKKMRSKKNYDY